MAAWLGGHAEGPPLAVAAAAVLAAAAAGWAGLRGACSPAGCEITWDGERWRVDGWPGRMELMLDLGDRLMLLRLRPDRPDRPDGPGVGGQARWLAIEAPGGELPHSGTRAAWRALRTAIYSPPPAAIPAEPAVRATDRAAD